MISSKLGTILACGLAVALPFTAACATRFDITRVTDAAGIAKLSAAVVRIDATNTLVKDQVMLVHDGASTFVVAPVVSTSEKSGGCYLHQGTSAFALNSAVKVAANEDASSCDAVVAMFACKRGSGNAIGVIVGMRLGGQNYYTEGSVFTVSAATMKEDVALSKKIEQNASAAAAKKALGCAV